VPDTELKKALIDRKLLNYRRYGTFLKKREEAIIKNLSERIGLGEEDFKVLEEWY
jgi:hypothetical protein